NADASEIRKAYRRLSLVLHPDKNDAPDAEIKFRQLVAVYDVLKDANKRSRYDEVLKNGLPDWRQAVYYYRRVRKMGLVEMSVILFILITIGQYIVSWAAYLERKYTAEQFLNMKLKKLQKKQRKGKYDGPALPETIILDIPTPSIWNTLPFQLPRWVFWFFVVFCPTSVTMVKAYWAEQKQRKEQELLEQSKRNADMDSKSTRSIGSCRAFTLPEVTSEESESLEAIVDQTANTDEPPEESKPPPLVSGGLWTDDDLVELVRLVKKFPPGTPSRWEKVASAMGRSVAEVTHMAKKVKEDGYRVVSSGPAEPEPVKPSKVKTRATDVDNNQDWSQVQQKALEAALIKFPKGASTDRWDKIAKCVPGKTKEDCMQRYKQLVEMLKKKKANGEMAPQMCDEKTT
ncbi:hypothetical protein L9F63_012433, partial [Diploptera punctata]